VYFVSLMYGEKAYWIFVRNFFAPSWDQWGNLYDDSAFSVIPYIVCN